MVVLEGVGFGEQGQVLERGAAGGASHIGAHCESIGQGKIDGAFFMPNLLLNHGQLPIEPSVGWIIRTGSERH